MSTTHYIPSSAGWASQKASYGSSTAGAGRLYLKCERTYNQSTNKSTLVFSLWCYSAYNAQFRITGTLKVGGSTLASFNTSQYVNTFNDTTFRQVQDNSGVLTWTLSNVSHDNNGTLSLPIQLDLSFATVGYSPNIYMLWGDSTTFTATEPRASAITGVTNPVSTGDSMTVRVTRANAAYHHKATVKYGNTVLYTSPAFGTSVSIPVPRGWFSSYPSAASLACTVEVQTYTDSGCTTALGDPATVGVTVEADSGMRPVLQSGYAAAAAWNTGTAAEGITGYVSGVSKAQVTLDSSKLDMSAAVGASVSSVAVTGGGVTDTSAPYITGVLTGTAAITVTVTDSRGRSAAQTLTVQTMPYAPPTLSRAQATRSDSEGSEDEDGTYSRVYAVAGCSSLEGQNSVTLTVSFAHGSGAYGTEQTIQSAQWTCLGGSQNPDLPTHVRFRAVDALGSETETAVLIPPRLWAMKFRENGLGVGFGMKPTEDRVLQLPAGWKIKIGDTIVAQG